MQVRDREVVPFVRYARPKIDPSDHWSLTLHAWYTVLTVVVRNMKRGKKFKELELFDFHVHIRLYIGRVRHVTSRTRPSQSHDARIQRQGGEAMICYP